MALLFSRPALFELLDKETIDLELVALSLRTRHRKIQTNSAGLPGWYKEAKTFSHMRRTSFNNILVRPLFM